MRLQRVPELLLQVQFVAVSPSFLFYFYHSCLDQSGDDSLHRTFGDTYPDGHFPCGGLGCLCEANEYVCVIAEEGPAGVVFIVYFLTRATWTGIRNAGNGPEGDTFRRFRIDIGRAMLIGLEFLVAGDVIRTVIISHSIEEVASLGLIVIIRTVLVFTIELEVNGHWPWQAASPKQTAASSSASELTDS